MKKRMNQKSEPRPKNMELRIRENYPQTLQRNEGIFNVCSDDFRITVTPLCLPFPLFLNRDIYDGNSVTVSPLHVGCTQGRKRYSFTEGNGTQRAILKGLPPRSLTCNWTWFRRWDVGLQAEAVIRWDFWWLGEEVSIFCVWEGHALLGTRGWTVVAGLQESLNYPCLPVFTPLCRPLPFCISVGLYDQQHVAEVTVCYLWD